MSRFVPPDFVPPTTLRTDRFLLEPLAPEHDVADLDAWSSSIEHIRATPGFVGRSWPRPMSLEENRRDLAAHAADFVARVGFTYTVLDPSDGSTIGCVYIYPPDAGDTEHDAVVRTWVRASRADDDLALDAAVRTWLAEAWPFVRPSSFDRS